MSDRDTNAELTPSQETAAERKQPPVPRAVAWLARHGTTIYRVAVVALLAFIGFKPIYVSGGHIDATVWTAQGTLAIQGAVWVEGGNLRSVESVDEVRRLRSVGSVESVDSVESVESVDSVGSVGSVRSVPRSISGP